MIITRKKEKCNYRMNIRGHEMSQKECIRCLGVMLGDSLTWKKHIAHISRKLSNGCWALSQIRKYSNSQMVKKCTLHCFIRIFNIAQYNQLGMCC